MAKRFTKSTIKWSEIDKIVPPDQRSNFMSFKGKSDGYLRRVLSNPPEPPKINWDEYKKIVPVPGLVDKFKSAYEAFKVPFPEDKLSAQIDDQWNKLEEEIKKFVADLQKDVEAANKQLKRINSLPKFDDMTLEMYADLFPEQAHDFVKKPTYWPHDEREQLDYVEPEVKVEKEKEKKK